MIPGSLPVLTLFLLACPPLPYCLIIHHVAWDIMSVSLTLFLSVIVSHALPALDNDDLAAMCIPLSHSSPLILLKLLHLSLLASMSVRSELASIVPSSRHLPFDVSSFSYSIDAPLSLSGFLSIGPPAHYRQPQPSTTMSW